MSNITSPSLAMTETSCGVDLSPPRRPRDSWSPVGHGGSKNVQNTERFLGFFFPECIPFIVTKSNIPGVFYDACDKLRWNEHGRSNYRVAEGPPTNY